ncbi:hypothetical protein DSO57_1019972 [Entomophthora muscae]|uniref:Uncharacterized protein n=1 Tax=Entomophthora muscae TaxID=34485 RepID=A0ACC2T4B8_9FUNG|nr:hypothetical protein DSO57_1019972 [Entomophthora muscae]
MAPLTEFQVGDLFLYYQNCIGSRAHKLDSLWVRFCEITYKKGVKYTIKLLLSGCLFTCVHAKFLWKYQLPVTNLEGEMSQILPFMFSCCFSLDVIPKRQTQHFDLFESHLESSSVPASLPTPAQAANQPANQNDNPGLEQLPTNTQRAPPSANQASAPVTQHIKHQIITTQILQEIVALKLPGLSWDQIVEQL